MRCPAVRVMMISAVCLAFAAPSSGEDGPRSEVFASVGRGTWWDDEGAPMTGLNFGGGIGRRLLPQFTIEIEVNGFRGARGYSVPTAYRVHGFYLVGNGVLSVFRRERAEVFVLLGAGAVRSTTEMTFGEYYYSCSGTGFAANAGTGMKIFITRRLALRPEVRAIAGTAGSSAIRLFSAEFRFSLGVGYHW